MPQRVHNRTICTNADLYIGQALEKYKPYSTIMPDVSVTVCLTFTGTPSEQRGCGMEAEIEIYVTVCAFSLCTQSLAALSLNKLHSPDTPKFQKS